MNSTTENAYSLFSGTYNKEFDKEDVFFWTKRQFSLCIPRNSSGMIFEVHSLENMEITIIRPSGKQDKFFVSNRWSRCGILFDDNEDFLLFSCSNTVFAAGDERELGICIKNIVLSSEREKVKSAKFENLKNFGNESYAIAWPMTIDHIAETSIQDWPETMDYTRYRSFELHLQHVSQNKIPGVAAEVGVYLAGTAAIINRYLPDKNIYLYDTFQGFDMRDVEIELSNSDVSIEHLDTLDYCNASKKVDDPVAACLERMPNKDKVIIRKGYFPETAATDLDLTFSFVSIDCDLYKPILDCLDFFYPRLNSGGYIFIHDYNSETLFGARRALQEFEAKLSMSNPPKKIVKFYLTDRYGSVIISK